MQKIADIYEHYKIMPNLELHQLRVAAVAAFMCDSLDIPVDKKSIIEACLLHDMGNIIKFDLSYTQKNFPEFLEPFGLAYWQEVQKEYIEKYGKEEHAATLKIIEDIGMSPHVIDLARHVDAAHIENIALHEDFGYKICMYADDRVTPHGIVSVEERNLEAEIRYKESGRAFDQEKKNFFMKNILDIQKQIFSHTSMTPEDISDAAIAPYIEKLRNFSIENS